MARNHYFSEAVGTEQALYENIIIESLKMYGQDVFYLPRDIVAEDKVLADDVISRFNSSYVVEMYIENTDGFDGEGDLFTKFGVEIRDQATFVVARRRWSETIGRYDNQITGDRPREGDLIYLPMSRSMFQIMHVEHEQPFYALRDLPTYKLQCELFEYTGEDFDTGVLAIDKIEKDYAYQYCFNFLQARAAATVSLDGTALDLVTVTDGGNNYLSTPTITESNGPVASAQAKFGSNSLYTNNSNTTSLKTYTGTYSSGHYNGYVEFQLYPVTLPSAGNFYHLVTSGQGLEQMSIGVNSSGQIVSIDTQLAVSAAQLATYDDDPGNNPTIQTGQWNYIRFSLEGPNAKGDKRVQVYVNGIRVFFDVAVDAGLIFGHNYTIGGIVSLFSGGLVLGAFDGYIDEWYANNANPTISTSISLPVAAQTLSAVGTTAYESFELEVPTFNISLSQGDVANVTVASSHRYYHQVPTFTFNVPDRIVYEVGETVNQTLLDGTILSAEVISSNPDTGITCVGHLGTDDGNFHRFVTTQPVVGATSGISALIGSISEEQKLSENEQNNDFETFADDILDFTESNPFGDVSFQAVNSVIETVVKSDASGVNIRVDRTSLTADLTNTTVRIT